MSVPLANRPQTKRKQVLRNAKPPVGGLSRKHVNARVLKALRHVKESRSSLAMSGVAPLAPFSTAIGAFVTAKNPVWTALLEAQSVKGERVTPIALFVAEERVTLEEDDDDDSDECEQPTKTALQQSELVFGNANKARSGGLHYARKSLPSAMRRQRARRKCSSALSAMTCKVDDLEICAAIEWGMAREAAAWPRAHTCDVLCGALLPHNAATAAESDSAELRAYSIVRCAARLRVRILLLDCGPRRSRSDGDRHIALRNALSQVTCALSYCGYSGRCFTVRSNRYSADPLAWRDIYVAVPSDNETACDALFAHNESILGTESVRDFVSLAVWVYALAH